MKNIFARKKKSVDEDPVPVPGRIGTVKTCVPSPTAEGKPESEKVYIITLDIDGTEYRTAAQYRCEEGQKVVVTTVGDMALVNPEKSEQLKAKKE